VDAVSSIGGSESATVADVIKPAGGVSMLMLVAVFVAMHALLTGVVGVTVTIAFALRPSLVGSSSLEGAALYSMISSIGLVALGSMLWYSNRFWAWPGIVPISARSGRLRDVMRLGTAAAGIAVALLIALQRQAMAPAMQLRHTYLIAGVLIVGASSWTLSYCLCGWRVLRSHPPAWSVDFHAGHKSAGQGGTSRSQERKR
jgi:hypothetical protein